MSMIDRIALIAALLALVVAAMSAALSATADSEEIVYQPPQRGAPTSRVGGGTRGPGTCAAKVRVLAPETTGWTAQAQPTLYWFLDQACAQPVEIKVTQKAVAAPLMSVRLPGPHTAGIHRLALGMHSVALQPGIDYRWSVALVIDADNPSNDIAELGTVALVLPDTALQSRLAATPAPHRAAVLAETGYWYDALAELCEQLAAEPTSRRAQAQRASLLRQGKLAEVAEWR